MKKKLLLSLVAATILGSSITVCAAPQYMADGAIFDPEWYLEQNPDVAAGWGIDISADAVYQHYTMHGANEGRKPFDETTLDMASILPYQGTDSTIETTQSTIPTIDQEQNVTSSQLPVVLMRDGRKLANENTIMAIEGQSYPLTLMGATNFDIETLSVSFRHIQKNDMNAESLEALAPYKLPGYEWREVQVVFVPESVDEFTNFMPDSYGYYADNSTNWNDRSIPSNGKFHQEAKFTVNINGIDYPECVIYSNYNFIDEYINFTKDFFILVPENYNGSISITVCGYKSRSRREDHPDYLKNSIRFDF